MISQLVVNISPVRKHYLRAKHHSKTVLLYEFTGQPSNARRSQAVPILITFDNPDDPNTLAQACFSQRSAAGSTHFSDLTRQTILLLCRTRNKL